MTERPVHPTNSFPARFPGARGMHSLVITAPGYEPFIQSVEFTQNIELTYNAPRVSKGSDSGMKTTEASMPAEMTPDIMTPDIIKEPSPPTMKENMNVDFNSPDF